MITAQAHLRWIGEVIRERIPNLWMNLGTSCVVLGETSGILWVNEIPPNGGFTGRWLYDIVTRGSNWKRFHSGADDRVGHSSLPTLPIEGFLFHCYC